jgi:hypothetical protein
LNQFGFCRVTQPVGQTVLFLPPSASRCPRRFISKTSARYTAMGLATPKCYA